MDESRALPARGVFSVERHPHAIEEGTYRRVSVGRLLHPRLNTDMTTSEIETRERLTPGPASAASVLWQYAPSLEATDHVKIASRYNLFIGGKFVEPHSK